jgi:hypothetical protein
MQTADAKAGEITGANAGRKLVTNTVIKIAIFIKSCGNAVIGF